MTTYDNLLREALAQTPEPSVSTQRRLRLLARQQKSAASRPRYAGAGIAAGALCALGLLLFLPQALPLRAAVGKLFLGSEALAPESFPYSTDTEILENQPTADGQLLSGVAASDGSWASLADDGRQMFIYHVYFEEDGRSLWHVLEIDRWDEDSYEDAVWRARKQALDFLTGRTDFSGAVLSAGQRMDSISDAAARTQLDFIRDGFTMALEDVRTGSPAQIIECDVFDATGISDTQSPQRLGIAWFALEDADLAAESLTLESTSGLPITVSFDGSLQQAQLVEGDPSWQHPILVVE